MMMKQGVYVGTLNDGVLNEENDGVWNEERQDSG